MAAQVEVPGDMKSVVRDLVLDSLKEAGALSKGWMVAVLDAAATRVISSVVSMYDITEERVTLVRFISILAFDRARAPVKKNKKAPNFLLVMWSPPAVVRAQVESLEKKRQPFPQMDVVYFLSPRAESVDHVIDDFKKGSYGNVHLLFLTKTPPECMARLQACPALIPRIKTFKELYVDFVSAESAVFHLDMPPAAVYSRLYNDEGLPAVAKDIASKLLTVCAALHECPIVKCRPNSPMESVASFLVVKYLPFNS